ncbi:MAG: hypothetical protein HY960_07295 [Ignavibacteriae bacterium]|nr:hypothetical protein [Ignavibacteriota bacterium]
MTKIFLSLFVLILISFSSQVCIAQHDDSSKNKSPEKKYDMKTYYMVFLKKGPNRDQDSVTAAKIQEGHLANIGRLAELGKIAIAGPFLDEGDVRGIFIMDCSSKEEADSLCQTDPAVKAGRLKAEVRPWMSARGAKLP